MNGHAFKGPGEKDLEKLGIPSSMHSDSSPRSTDSALVKTKGGGGGAAGKKAKEDREASNANALAANENRPTPEMERANTPGSENSAVKPKAALKKVGWMAAKTYFKSDAEVYAEFDIPAEIKDKTLVEFELFRKENAELKSVKKVQAHTDTSGRASAVLPVPASEEPKVTFVIKVKHCLGNGPMARARNARFPKRPRSASSTPRYPASIFRREKVSLPTSTLMSYAR